MDETIRSLNMIVRSFAIAAVVAVFVLTVVDFGDPANPDLASGAALAAAAFGALGLLIALHWWSRIGESPQPANNLMLHFVARVAIAEIGLLMGILGLIMTGSSVAAFIGLGFFLAALYFMALGLRRVS